MENRVDVKILCGKDLIAMDFSGTNDFGLNNTLSAILHLFILLLDSKFEAGCHSSRQLSMVLVANIVKLQSSLTMQSKSVGLCLNPITTENK